MLVPVIGVIQVGPQAMADRYTYLPQIGLAVAATWLAAGLVAEWPRWRLPAAAFATVILLSLIVLAWLQTAYWRDSKTLWEHALSCTTGNWFAHGGLGTALSEAKQYDRAIDEFDEAIRIRPDYAQGHFSLGRALERRAARGDIDAAIDQYRRALACDPTLPTPIMTSACCWPIAAAPARRLRNSKTRSSTSPNKPTPITISPVAWNAKASSPPAMVAWRAALRLEPDNVDTVEQVAWRLATSPDASVRNGRRAVELAQRAVQLSGGDDPRPIGTLAAALAEAGRFPEAVEIAQQAIKVAMRRRDAATAAATTEHDGSLRAKLIGSAATSTR